MGIPIPDPEPEDPQVAIMYDIIAERQRQKSLSFGGKPADQFDLLNTRNDWIAYILAYLGRASDRVARNEKEGQDYRRNLVKAGALIMAALESHDAGLEASSPDGDVPDQPY